MGDTVEHVEGWAERGDVRLWWERIGDGERAIVLHPGGGDTADVFPRSLFERFVSAGFTVVGFDPRDTGRSTRTPDDVTYDGAAMAADLWAVADAAGIGHAVLLGYSNGGMVVQLAAAEAPDRVDGLVLLSTYARPPDLEISEEAIAEMLDAGPVADPDAPLDVSAMRHWYAGADDAGLAELGERMSAGRAPTNRSTSRHAMATMATTPPSDAELASVRAPVLVVHSTDDRIVPHGQADATARPYPSSTVARVHGIGHVPVERQWHEIADVILGSL